MNEPSLAVDALLEDLKSGDVLTRRSAIFQLARTREDRAIARFKEIASTDESMELRYLARKALHLLSASPKTAETAAPPSSGKTQIIATEDVDTISIRLFSEDPSIRASALRASGLRKDARLLPAVLMRADPGVEPHPEVRSLLPIVLAILGGVEQISEIASFITDPDPRVKSNAIEALGRLNDVAAYAIIIRSLQDLDHRVISTAIKTLGRLGKVNVIQCCREMLNSPEYWVRDAAAFCLASAKYQEAIPLLATALEDEHEAVRIKAKNGLEKLAQDGYVEAREALSHAFDIKNRESPDDFLKLESSSSVWRPDFLTSEDVRLRRRAARQLAVRGARGKSLENAIHQLKVEDDPGVLSQLLVAVAKSRKSEAISAIEPLLKHESSQVRVAAVETLTAIGTPEAKTLIIPLLKDKAPEVLGKAILGLSDVLGSEIEGPLESLMDNTDYAHKSMAIAVISELADPNFYHYLEMLSHDEDEEVVSMARDSLAMLQGGSGNSGKIDLSGSSAVKRLVTDRIDAREPSRTPRTGVGAKSESHTDVADSSQPGEIDSTADRRKIISGRLRSVLTVLGTLIVSVGLGALAGLLYRGSTNRGSTTTTAVPSPGIVVGSTPNPSPGPRATPRPGVKPGSTISPAASPGAGVSQPPPSSPSLAATPATPPSPGPSPGTPPGPTKEPAPLPSPAATEPTNPALNDKLNKLLRETVAPALETARSQIKSQAFDKAAETLHAAIQKVQNSAGDINRATASTKALRTLKGLDEAFRTIQDDTLYDFERVEFAQLSLGQILGDGP